MAIISFVLGVFSPPMLRIKLLSLPLKEAGSTSMKYLLLVDASAKKMIDEMS